MSAGLAVLPVDRGQDEPGELGGPGRGGVGEDVHGSGTDLHGVEHVQPSQGHGVDVEEVGGEGSGGLGAQELALRRGAAASSGCGAQVGAAQDAPDGGGSDSVAEASQFALDEGAAPGRILAGQAQDECGEFLGDRRASGPGGFLFPFPPQESAVPGQEGARKPRRQR